MSAETEKCEAYVCEDCLGMYSESSIRRHAHATGHKRSHYLVLAGVTRVSGKDIMLFDMP